MAKELIVVDKEDFLYAIAELGQAGKHVFCEAAKNRDGDNRAAKLKFDKAIQKVTDWEEQPFTPIAADKPFAGMPKSYPVESKESMENSDDTPF